MTRKFAIREKMPLVGATKEPRYGSHKADSQLSTKCLFGPVFDSVRLGVVYKVIDITAKIDRRLSGNGCALEYTGVMGHGLEAHVFKSFRKRVKSVIW